MMFDPASLGQALQPGDKMTLTFHKGQPKLGGGSFMDNASKAGMVPPVGASAPPAALPPAEPPMPMGGPAPTGAGPAPDAGIDPAQRMMLMNALRARMGQ